MQFKKVFDESAWSTRFSVLALIIITITAFAPFLDKAFHIDDTLFLAAARQIQSHPFDPYGFNVTWYYDEMPMWEVFKNPPLACYYIALVSLITGFSEIALHTAFLIPAIAVVIGTYFIAARFCRRPVLAALISFLTPAFLVSGSGIMCDVMMLAFWVWAILLWLRGTEKNNHALLAGSMLLITASILTKYYGIMLIALLSLYTLIKKDKLGLWILYFAIPVAILSWYQCVTKKLYGSGMLTEACDYATYCISLVERKQLLKLLTGLGFTGGSFIVALFYLPFLWRRKALMAQAALFIFAILAVASVNKISMVIPIQNAARPLVNMHLGIFAAVGINILALSCLNLRDDRYSAESIFICLWIIGTFVFATFVNWTINVRSILPLAPALGILLARRIDRIGADKENKSIWWPLLPAAIVALLVTQADSGLANSARAAAQAICSKYGASSGRLRYEGHWGFQYYMDLYGAHIIQRSKLRLKPDEILIVPENNCDPFPIHSDWSSVNIKEIMVSSAPRWGTTMNRYSGAGFYHARIGPLPFIFGPVPKERYNVLQITQSDVDKEDYVRASFLLKYPDALNKSCFGYEDCFMIVQLGEKYFDNGEYRKAISCYTQALIIYPYDPAALVNRGCAYILKGEIDKGLADCRRAAEIDPMYEKVLYMLETFKN